MYVNQWSGDIYYNTAQTYGNETKNHIPIIYVSFRLWIACHDLLVQRHLLGKPTKMIQNDSQILAFLTEILEMIVSFVIID